MSEQLDRLFEEARAVVCAEYPSMSVSQRGSNVIIEGPFAVLPLHAPEHQTFGAFTHFEVRIELPEDFPFAEPLVYETAGDLPRDIDRHVYSDGRCCIEVWYAWCMRQRITQQDISVRSLLQGPVHNFFFGQYEVDQGRPWPYGEYAHGRRGIMEALADLFKVPAEKERVLARLKILKRTSHQDDLIKRGWVCDCGSGKRIVHCHLDDIIRQRAYIPPKWAHLYYKMINEWDGS